MVGELETTIGKAEIEIGNIEDILRTDLPAIQRDPKLAESKAPQLEKLVDIISKAQSELTDEYDKAKQAVEDGGKALKQMETGKKKALGDLAELDKYTKSHWADAQKLMKDARDAHNVAVTAFVERDRVPLEKARAAMGKLQIKTFERLPKDLDDGIRYFLKTWKDKGLGEAVDKQFDTYTAKLGDLIDDVRAWVKQALEDEDRVRGYVLPKPDVAKAIKELDLGDMPDAKQKDCVGKAIVLPLAPMEKAFDSIVKEFKLKASGKQMVKTLMEKNVV